MILIHRISYILWNLLKSPHIQVLSIGFGSAAKSSCSVQSFQISRRIGFVTNRIRAQLSMSAWAPSIAL